MTARTGPPAKTPADIAIAGVAAAIEYDVHCARPIQVETL